MTCTTCKSERCGNHAACALWDRILTRWRADWCEGWHRVAAVHRMRLEQPHSYLCARRVVELATRRGAALDEKTVRLAVTR